jgi:MFS family permease
MTELFSDPRWRYNAIIGMLLAFAGVVGLWGIGFFSFDLFRAVLDKTDLTDGEKTFWIGMTSLLQNAGAFFGIYVFTHVTQSIGRKKAFAIAFVLAMISTAYTFWNLNTFSDIFWMIPIMGFCQLSLFGGYAIYLPELFPTRLRSTGTSFCYNVGRFVAALGPLALGLLTSRVFAGYPEPMRYAGVAMCLVFLIGLATVPFAPETKGKPLPE